MATLEKIRKKSVFLLIIIGIALIAFIIGDFLTSGRLFFGSGTTVAKADGEKVEIQDFQRRMEQESAPLQQIGYNIPHADLQQLVLAQMMDEKLLEKEYEKLGITVTDKELSDFMVGPNSNSYMMPYLMSDPYAQQFGINNAAQYYDIAFNPGKYQGIDQNLAQAMQVSWQSMEKSVESDLKKLKFASLLEGTLTANDLDARSLYDDGALTYNVAYVYKDLSSLKDEDFPVSDQEINSAWEKDKKRFALLEPTRNVNFINVVIEPSGADMQAAAEEVREAIASLRTTPDLTGISGNYKFTSRKSFNTLASITDSRVKDFLENAEPGDVTQISQQGIEYDLRKLLNKTSQADSVNIDRIWIATGDIDVDTLLSQLNSGVVSLDSVKQMAGVMVEEAQSIPLVDIMNIGVENPQVSQYTTEFLNTVDTIVPNTYFLNLLGFLQSNQQALAIDKVNYKGEPVEVYEIADIHYTAEPSSTTVNQLRYDLQAYANSNSTADKFSKNASPKYQTVNMEVGASTPGLRNVNDSRSAIAWAMKAKKGEVSPIFGNETSGSFYVVALNDIYKDFIPSSDPNVRRELTEKIRNEKKTASLIKEYKGKANNIEGYATLMGGDVDSTALNYLQVSPVFGPEALAYVATAKEGSLVGPVGGNEGVVVFVVKDIENNARPYESEKANKENQFLMLNNIANLLYQLSLPDQFAKRLMMTTQMGTTPNTTLLHSLLLGKEKMENNLLNFSGD